MTGIRVDMYQYNLSASADTTVNNVLALEILEHQRK